MDDELVTEISRVLLEVLRANEVLDGPVSPSAAPLSPFDGPRAPAYPLDRYLQRISRYTYCGSNCLLVALIYVDRAAMKDPMVKITSRNIHRLLITAVVLAMKFWSDQFFDNEYYARVGGIPARELCSLEIWMLKCLDFELNVEEQLFDEYRSMLANRRKSSPIGIPCRDGSGIAISASPGGRMMAMTPANLNASVASSVPARVPVIVTFDALAGCGEGPSPSSSPMRYCISRRWSPQV